VIDRQDMMQDLNVGLSVAAPGHQDRQVKLPITLAQEEMQSFPSTCLFPLYLSN